MGLKVKCQERNLSHPFARWEGKGKGKGKGKGWIAEKRTVATWNEGCWGKEARSLTSTFTSVRYADTTTTLLNDSFYFLAKYHFSRSKFFLFHRPSYSICLFVIQWRDQSLANLITLKLFSNKYKYINCRSKGAVCEHLINSLIKKKEHLQLFKNIKQYERNYKNVYNREREKNYA